MSQRNPPKVLQREIIADTGIFRIQAIDLEFSNGAKRRHQRIVGSAQGAVLVVPFLDQHTVLLIREYAAGMDRYELAFPKGNIEPGETPKQAANREIQEEIGYAADHLEHFDSVTIAPGYLQHTTHLVLASQLHSQRLPGDEPEPIDVVPWPLKELDALFARDDFTEARSMLALLLLLRHEPRTLS